MPGKQRRMQGFKGPEGSESRLMTSKEWELLWSKTGVKVLELEQFSVMEPFKSCVELT